EQTKIENQSDEAVIAEGLKIYAVGGTSVRQILLGVSIEDACGFARAEPTADQRPRERDVDGEFPGRDPSLARPVLLSRLNRVHTLKPAIRHDREPAGQHRRSTQAE